MIHPAVVTDYKRYAAIITELASVTASLEPEATIAAAGNTTEDETDWEIIEAKEDGSLCETPTSIKPKEVYELEVKMIREIYKGTHPHAVAKKFGITPETMVAGIDDFAKAMDSSVDVLFVLSQMWWI